jgi:hypothetical protein
LLPSRDSFSKKKYKDFEVKHISKIFKRGLPKYILEKNNVFRKKGAELGRLTAPAYCTSVE